MIYKNKIAHNSNYTKGRKSPIKYLVIHFTANDGDSDENNADYFAKANRNASAHYFVDDDSCTLSVLESDIAWHCGSNNYRHPYCRNSNSIGIEMCSNKENGIYYISKETISNTVELTQKLMKKYNIPIDCVLRHFDVTGKMCPEPFVRNNKLWLDFKKSLIDETEVKNLEVRFNNIKEIPEWGKSTVQKMIDDGKFGDINKLDLSMDMLRLLVLINR